MKATIDQEGNLKIDMQAIIAALPESDLRMLAKYAVFQEHLLSGIIDALVDDQMWPDDAEGPWWFGGDTFTKLRLKLVALLPEITAQAVRHVELEMRRARQTSNEWREACFRLLREWPEGPRPEPWPYSNERSLTKDQAVVYLRDVEQRIVAEQTQEVQ